MPQSSVDLVVARNLRETLKVSGKSAYAVATALGHAPNWLYRVINRESGILLPTLREVAAELDVSAGSLVNSQEDLGRETEGTVRLVEVEAKPETGAAKYNETPRRFVYVPLSILPDPNIDPFFTQLVRIEGSGMTSTYPDGTLIVVDRLRRELKEGNTFVLETVEGLLVRRVRYEQKINRWLIGGKDGDDSEFYFDVDTRIVGQVIGAWLNLL